MDHEEKIKRVEENMKNLQKWDNDRQEKDAQKKEELRISGRDAIETRKTYEKETEIDRAYDMANEIGRMERRLMDRHEQFLKYMENNELTLMFQQGGTIMEIFPINGPSANKFKLMAYEHGIKNEEDIYDFIVWLEFLDEDDKDFSKFYDALKEKYGHVETKDNPSDPGGFPLRLIIGNTDVCEIGENGEGVVNYLKNKISLL